MIGYFPQPYYDELWYSVCARFSDRMRFGTETGVMLALYGRRHAIAIVDLPHRLDAVASQLPAGHSCTTNNIIDHHSFLPYYGPFLTTTSYAVVRRLMEDGTKPSVRVRCGACTNRVRPPKYFRSCPVCDRENHEKCGETCWRRLFQLPGVEVCAIHNVFLEPSDIRLDPLPNRHKYFSAQSSRRVANAHPIDSKDPSQVTLRDLARDIDWLLRQERLNPGLQALHARYSQVLAERGFATKAGSIRMADVRREVLVRYGEKLLHLLQSDLPNEKGDGWLGHLLRKQNTAVAPLRHLLLLRALEVDLKQFFFPDVSRRSNDSSSNDLKLWPCPNPVCDQHGKSLIEPVENELPGKTGNRHLTIKCPACGYSYQVRDVNGCQSNERRLVAYGTKWTDILKAQWADSSISLRQMSKILGVDPKTVKQQAARLDLKFPRMGNRPVTRLGLYVAVNRDKTKEIESHRLAWTNLVSKNPISGTKQLRSLAPALYAWLYRNDRPWLTQHKPARKKSPAARSYVDWAARDEQLASQIATIAAHIKHRPGKLRQVTVTAIGRTLGKQSLFEAALAKLPLTRSIIDSVVESGVEFAVRRVHAAAQRLRLAGGAFARWKLVQAAGLHYRLERHPEVKAALDYEVRPPVNVVILRDHGPVPDGLIRHPKRIPSRLRPLAIVREAA